jgi:hypothetical protein
MTIFPNKEFNFQLIYSAKMLFQSLLMINNLIIYYLLAYKKLIKHPKAIKFARDQFLNQAVINFTRNLIYFDLCLTYRYTSFDTIVLIVAFLAFSTQQFIVLGVYFNKDKSK